MFNSVIIFRVCTPSAEMQKKMELQKLQLVQIYGYIYFPYYPSGLLSSDRCFRRLSLWWSILFMKGFVCNSWKNWKKFISHVPSTRAEILTRNKFSNFFLASCEYRARRSWLFPEGTWVCPQETHPSKKNSHRVQKKSIYVTRCIQHFMHFISEWSCDFEYHNNSLCSPLMQPTKWCIVALQCRN